MRSFRSYYTPIALLTLATVLVPAWASAGLCATCAGKMFVQNIGKCATCGGATTSSSFKFCETCSAKLKECQACCIALSTGSTTVAPVAPPVIQPIAPPVVPPVVVPVVPPVIDPVMPPVVKPGVPPVIEPGVPPVVVPGVPPVVKPIDLPKNVAPVAPAR